MELVQDSQKEFENEVKIKHIPELQKSAKECYDYVNSKSYLADLINTVNTLKEKSEVIPQLQSEIAELKRVNEVTQQKIQIVNKANYTNEQMSNVFK